MDTISATQVLSGLSTLVGGVVVLMLRALSAKLTSHGEDLARIGVTLTGASGDNGLVGDVKQLRSRSHELGDRQNTTAGKVEILTMRLDTLDRRVGPDDRRSPA